MKKLLILCLLAVTGTVQAALFQGSSQGVFVNPAGAPGMITTGVDTNAFTWGDGTAFNSPPSSLGYLGESFDEDENDAFTFGNLTYFNGTIAGGTEATSVDLSVELNFISPAALLESFVFNLALINTPNVGTPADNADIVNFDNTVPSNFFSFSGTDYTLEFLGFGMLTGSGFTIEDSFLVLEGGMANVDLVGQITSTPGISVIPVPAAVWLFGTAMIGLVGFGKRRKAA